MLAITAFIVVIFLSLCHHSSNHHQFDQIGHEIQLMQPLNLLKPNIKLISDATDSDGLNAWTLVPSSAVAVLELDSLAHPEASSSITSRARGYRSEASKCLQAPQCKLLILFSEASAYMTIKKKFGRLFIRVWSRSSHNYE